MCWASFFAEEPPEGRCWANFFAPTGAVPRTCSRCGALQAGCGGGFALHEAFLRRVASVSNPRVVQFPPTGDGEAAVCSAGAPKPQTTSVKNTENGLLVARWSVFWAQRCLSWRVASANLLVRAVTRSIARKPDMWSVGGAAQARISG